MMVLIIDYGMGNLESIAKALTKLNINYIISSSKDDFEKSSHLILPGVGNFKEGILNLVKNGLDKLIYNEVVINNKPLLGICLGMQLLFEGSDEGSEVRGLSYFPGLANIFSFQDKSFKLPHVGWNSVYFDENLDFELFKKIKPGTDFYFVHSYKINQSSDYINHSTATTEYETTFISYIAKENIVGAQFHPEKSQTPGLTFLNNFCNWKPINAKK